MPRLYPAPDRSGAPDTRPLIAVVDDDPDTLQSVDVLLTHHGYRTILWPTGKDAHLMIRRDKPDLVILDLWLEERFTGEMVLDLMQADPDTQGIPVLMISGHVHALRGMVQRLAARGYAVLEKPFTADELVGAVASVIGPARAK